MAKATIWREGRIIFDNDTLANAVSEVKLYRQKSRCYRLASSIYYAEYIHRGHSGYFVETVTAFRSRRYRKLMTEILLDARALKASGRISPGDRVRLLLSLHFASAGFSGADFSAATVTPCSLCVFPYDTVGKAVASRTTYTGITCEDLYGNIKKHYRVGYGSVVVYRAIAASRRRFANVVEIDPQDLARSRPS